MECNIVFYKHENFIAHKQHYCASRRAVKTSPQISPKLSPREVAESNSSSVVLAKKSPELINKPSISLNSEEKLDLLNNSSRTHVMSAENSEKKANFSYYCVPCKIKFSSASTLKAHKDYYCPHGKNSEQSLILCKADGHSESSCSEADDNSLEDSFYTCNHCHTSYTSSRLYRHHYCPANMQNPMVRCPHCDYVAPTQNKLTEHMKAHTSSRGYKCLLCGYRGNTVRGMRMHGKTHTDNGEEFNEKHVLEVEEPPLLPVSFKNGTSDVFGSLDMEAELIRLKNEPYKRRRSRKSYERMDISNHELLHACKICGETFSDMKAFQMHNSIHRTSPLVSHTIPRPKSVNNNKDLEDSSPGNSQLHNIHVTPCLDQNATITSKKFKYTENADPNSTPLKCFPKTSGEISPTLSQPRKTPSYNSNVLCLKYEDSKDGNLKNVVNAFQSASVQNSAEEPVANDHQTKTAPSISPLIQVKPEPIDHGYDKAENNMNGPAQSNSPSLSEIANICVKIEAEKEECSERRDASLNLTPPKEESSVPPHSKLETSTNHTPKTSPSPPRPSSTPSSPTAAPLSVLASASSPIYVYNKSQYLKGERTDSPSNHVPETHLSKYCQQCDISFTYLATFLAHKKHYCSARFPTEPKPSVTA
ncbi:finger ush-like [Octopus vulgaris]|uniref:Finger ush-like n=1 Tax=Octopus vulgaris TaxID=6645 RepID=A0AA36F5K8_OCTVU|nr:finger ush-like [Octopus vulgaris]